MARTPFSRRSSGTSAVVRLLARGLASGRIAIGAALVALPDTSVRRWLGATGEGDPGRQIAIRGLGARDVVLGVGTLVALRDGNDARRAARWLDAGVVADLADAASTALAEDLDAPKTPAVALALSGAALGLALRARLR